MKATYDAHETERMRELDGRPLATFGRRASAFAIDLVAGGVLFFVVAILITLAINGRVSFHISGLRIGSRSANDVRLTFFENGYGILWWVLYFGLSTYFGRGQTIGKRLTGIRIVSLVHHRLSLWHSIE